MSNAGTRARHRGADASWVAIGATSIAALVACALPAFRIGLDAYIGAGNRQRSFLYDREVTLADLLPWSLLIPTAALLLLQEDGSLSLVTFMPSVGKRQHDGARTRSPAISTMHERQLPTASRPAL